MINLLLNALQFLSARENQQDITKSGRFGEVPDSKTLDLFAIMAESDESQNDASVLG